MSLLTNKIYMETNNIISTQNLNSQFSDYILDEETEELISQYEPYFTEFEKTVTIIDEVKNPYGIYKYMQNYAELNGAYKTKEMIFMDNDTKKTYSKTVKDYYVPNDPEEYVIVIVDHLSLLRGENGQDTHAAMSKFSSEYALDMRDMWKYTIVGVQQQSAISEQQQFTNTGGSIISKLRPSADGLGDNKLVGRDVNLMIGLFGPYRYGIQSYNGYDISILKDNYRELLVLFNRDGEGFFSTDLLFNGAVNHFEEAPDNRVKPLTKEDYNNILKRIRKG